MEEVQERIAVLRSRLNQLLEEQENEQYPSPKIYLLSVMLDQEIVRYYKSLASIKC